MKNLLIALALITVNGCVAPKAYEKEQDLPTEFSRFQMYSEHVKDTFLVQVHVPEGYSEQDSLPTVYLLDGNFFGPMLSSAVQQMQVAGKLPPLILVSIGYSSFEKMDSLRVRDYLYPAAVPSDEMDAPGGGKNFHDFITMELVGKIDEGYKTDRNNRVLMGHSFGAYFALYSLLDLLENKTGPFHQFIAASPTLWYNDFYLSQIPDKLDGYGQENIQVYTSVGGLENEQWSIAPILAFSDSLELTGHHSLKAKNVVFNELDHMDVAMVSFLKGLEFILSEPAEQNTCPS